jgi:hypothetical protein
MCMNKVVVMKIAMTMKEEARRPEREGAEKMDDKYEEEKKYEEEMGKMDRKVDERSRILTCSSPR